MRLEPQSALKQEAWGGLMCRGVVMKTRMECRWVKRDGRNGSLGLGMEGELDTSVIISQGTDKDFKAKSKKTFLSAEEKTVKTDRKEGGVSA